MMWTMKRMLKVLTTGETGNKNHVFPLETNLPSAITVPSNYLVTMYNVRIEKSRNILQKLNLKL
jgi:hypothetical protein